jgi:hypothetical protein
MIQTFWTEICKCCGGYGTQVRKDDGLTVLCPCCGGSGKRQCSNYDNLPPGVYCMSDHNSSSFLS